MNNKNIDRRDFLRAGTYALAGLSTFAHARDALGVRKGFSASISPAGLAGRRPNMILVVTDDQGSGDVGYMGHPYALTPALDEMAATGLRMDRFYTQPGCSPSRACLMTGRNPNRCGVFRYGNQLRPEETTLATPLRDAGYMTGFFGKWHLGSVVQGRPTSPDTRGFDIWSASPNFFTNDPWFSRNGQAVKVNGEGSAATVNEALPFIRDAVSENRPFLAVICLGAPHTPHEADPEFFDLYGGLGLSNQLRNYYGELSGIDRAVGMIRDKLRELGIERNTLLWFSSDDGGRPADGARHLELRGAKTDLWEGGIRVPSLIEWPGRIAARITNTPCGHEDVYPTLLELAGVSIPHNRPIDGISLVPCLEGREAERSKPLGRRDGVPKIAAQLMNSDSIMQTLYDQQQAGQPENINEGILHGPIPHYPDAGTEPCVWIDGDWKLHRMSEGDYRLFNLDSDPGEQINVIAQLVQRPNKMEGDMLEWEQSVVLSIRGEDY